MNTNRSKDSWKDFKSLTCIINGKTHVFDGPDADLSVVLARLRESMGVDAIMADDALIRNSSVKNAKKNAKTRGHPPYSSYPPFLHRLWIDDWQTGGGPGA